MPADRSRQPRRDASQLVWTNPIEPADNSASIEFAHSATPLTFADAFDADSYPPPMFPPAEDGAPSTPRKPGHCRKKPENHIPRPPNAFILFRSSFIKSQHVSSEVETNHSTLSKIIGLTWQNLPEEERKVWHNKAKAVLDEHKRKFPEYAFRPLHSRAKGVAQGGAEKEKRKVREVGPKDMKRCAKIAELLVKGKKGEELDRAIQEFDKTHVPEVVTRFEAPITARAFRRSSSAPPPDAPPRDNDSFLLVDPSTPSKRKLRASSSKPPSCPQPLQRSVSLDTFGDFSFPVKSQELEPSAQLLNVADQLAYDASSFDMDGLAPFLHASSPGSPCHSSLSINTEPDFLSMHCASSPSTCTSFSSTPDSSMPSTPLFSGSFVEMQMPALVAIPSCFDDFTYQPTSNPFLDTPFDDAQLFANCMQQQASFETQQQSFHSTACSPFTSPYFTTTNQNDYLFSMMAENNHLPSFGVVSM